jgi:hypothetical protein
VSKRRKKRRDLQRALGPAVDQGRRTVQAHSQAASGDVVPKRGPKQSISMLQRGIATYRVNVLLENMWEPVAAVLQRRVLPEYAVEALDVLDALIELAAPALAIQALSLHVRQHAPIYQCLGIGCLSFQPVSDYQHYPTTVWGELHPSAFLGELHRLVAVANEMRRTVHNTPDNLFWPGMGAFFSAVDQGAQILERTWQAVAAAPERFTLVEVFVTVHNETTPVSKPAVNSLELARSQPGWWICSKCSRMFQAGEQILLDNHRLCPYGCSGEITGDADVNGVE